MKLYFDKSNKDKAQALKYIAYALAALLLSLIHLVFLNFIAVGGITPDLLLILCVWIALSEGQFVALFAGFACGLLFDILTVDVIGTNALAKTIVALVAGWFYRENKSDKIIRSYKFLLIVLLCSLIHNFVYYFFYIKPSEMEFFPFFLKYGVAISLYTTVFAIFAMLLKIPRKKLVI